MGDILKEYKEMAVFVKKSLGNLYEVFVLEYENGRLRLMESDGIDESFEGEIVKNCLALVSESIRERKMSFDQLLGTEEGKLRRLSARLILDEKGAIVGVFCILLQCGPFLRLIGLAEEFLHCERIRENDKYPSTLEGIEKYVNDFVFRSEEPTKEEKTEIICDLYNMGMFDIKGAVAKVADMLHMSVKSVYRYIKNINEARNR